MSIGDERKKESSKILINWWVRNDYGIDKKRNKNYLEKMARRMMR
jgi:hypothetical protein